MTDHQTDEGILATIKKLVSEEHELHSAKELDARDQARLQTIRVELDQAWDLLRQRRALREFGGDPDKAEVRPPNIVENYTQ
jgi:predicted Zn-dependent peptidase